MPASMRLGISALSREDKANAVPEELMVDKSTGQMLIRTPDGHVVSQDAVQRLSTHIRQIEDRVTSNGYMGDIGVLELDSEYPITMAADPIITLVDTESAVVLFDDTPQEFLVSIDLDVVKLSSTYSDLVATGDFITMGVRYTRGEDLDELVEVTLHSSALANKFFDPADVMPKTLITQTDIVPDNFDMTGVTATLEKLEVVKSSEFEDASQYQYILNSVVVFTEK